MPLNSPNQPFDVFLSHNTEDKPSVEQLAVRLQEEKLTAWLDKWDLVPGDDAIDALENALGQSRACAVFLGPGGIGPWQKEERQAALRRRVRDKSFRVIPVLLPGATLPTRGDLPDFLSGLVWVDFRAKGLQDSEEFHRLVCGIKGVSPRRGLIPTITPVECPYRGLEVFDEEHARFFFGREAMTQHLVEALRPTRFLCVLGPSGSGKSSLARAGLLPQLRGGQLPGSQHWQYLVFKPGAHPIEELALNLAALQTAQNQVSTAAQLINDFKATETALHLFARLLLRTQAPDTQFFLLVDQFEEVFTLCQDAAERAQFIKNLRYAGTIDGGRVVIVPTMRADFLARAAESPDLAELLSTHQFIVNPMEPDELRRAIEEPARLAGLRFEPGLVEPILSDVGHEPGALPLLEHALRELFEKRSRENVLTVQAYEQSGGVQGALAQKAEAIYARLTPEQQTILRRVMLRLTQPGEGTADTRRRAVQHELWNRAEERAAVEQVIHMLADERLLTTSHDAGGEEQLDVAHEALIRGWPRLRNWIDEDREGLRLHHRLTEDTKEWRKRGKDESFLYQGLRLVQAIEWRQNNDAEANELEREFLAASEARESRIKLLDVREKLLRAREQILSSYSRKSRDYEFASILSGFIQVVTGNSDALSDELRARFGLDFTADSGDALVQHLRVIDEAVRDARVKWIGLQSGGDDNNPVVLAVEHELERLASELLPCVDVKFAKRLKSATHALSFHQDVQIVLREILTGGLSETSKEAKTWAATITLLVETEIAKIIFKDNFPPISAEAVEEINHGQYIAPPSDYGRAWGLSVAQHVALSGGGRLIVEPEYYGDQITYLIPLAKRSFRPNRGRPIGKSRDDR